MSFQNKGKRKRSAVRQTKKRPIDTKKLRRQLEQMQAKLKEMMKEDGVEIGEEQVKSARDFAEQMQEINRGLRESLRRAMMADGKIKPGQTITAAGRYVRLQPRPGCPDGSTDPDHYDLVYEIIH